MKKRNLLYAVLVVTLLGLFQNCNTGFKANNLQNTEDVTGLGPADPPKPPRIPVVGTLTIEALPTKPQSVSELLVKFSGDAVINAQTPTFECRLDDSSWNSCVSPYNLTALPEGNHSFQVRALDPDINNIGTSQAPFKIDRTAPVASFSASPSGLLGPGEQSLVFAATDNLSTAFSFECSFDSGSFGPCTSPHKVTSSSEGDHDFKVIASDEAGNKSAEIKASWKVNTTAPSIAITPINNSAVAKQSVSFSATDKSGSPLTFECTFNNGTPAPCTSPLEVTATTEGSQSIKVKVTNSTNFSATASATWIWDKTAPTVNLDVNPSSKSPYNTSNIAMGFTAADNLTGVDRFECAHDSGAFGPCTSPINHVAGEGQHTFKVRAIDKVGNISADISAAYVVDLTAPSIAIQSGPENNANPVTISVNSTDALTGPPVLACSLNSGAFVPCESPVNFSNLADGNYSLQIRSTDRAGNSSFKSVTWYIDRTAPVLTITSFPANNDIQPTITFTVSETLNGPATVTCSMNKGIWLSCSSPIKYENQGDGKYDLEIRAEDKAGNSATKLVSWYIDRAPPTSPAPVTLISNVEYTFSWIASADGGSGLLGYEYAAGTTAGSSNLLAWSTPITATKVTLPNNFVATNKFYFSVRAVDKAGNKSTIASSGAVDPQAVRICTIADFDLMRNNLSGNFIQVCDVDLASVDPWIPIGGAPLSGKPFRGTFNGNGKVIRNLHSDHGLFDEIEGAQISNVTILGAAIKRYPSSPSVLSNIGILASLAGWEESPTPTTTITNCKVQGSIVVSTAMYVGGLVGNLKENGKVVNSSAEVTITFVKLAQGVMANHTVGGLVGQHNGEIEGSSASGSISGAESRSFIGGLVGAFYNKQDYDAQLNKQVYLPSHIRNSTSTVTMNVPQYAIGGLVGYAQGQENGGTVIVVNSSYKGSVTGSSGVGGLIGAFNGSNVDIIDSESSGNISGTSQVGGLVGFGGGRYVRSSSRATVSASSSIAGGLTGSVGYPDGCSTRFEVVDSYFAGTVTGSSTVGGITGAITVCNPDTFPRPVGPFGITNSYSVGKVSGLTAGGLVAYADVGYTNGEAKSFDSVFVAKSSYWATDLSTQSTSRLGTASTSAPMHLQSLYSGWNFTTIWNPPTSTAFPTLR